MTNPPNNTAGSKLWVSVIGIITVIALGTVLAVVVVCKYRQHRQKLLTYSYAQLTSDLAEEPSDDDRLLMG
jgi:hypothetical protein